MEDELTNKVIKAINKVFSKENMDKIFRKVSDKIKEKKNIMDIGDRGDKNRGDKDKGKGDNIINK